MKHRTTSTRSVVAAALSSRVALCVALSLAGPSASAAESAPGALEALLQRAGRSVGSFQAVFTQVLGFERYRQEVHAEDGGDMADLESEVFFVGFDDRHRWLTVRHVLSVNGRSVGAAAGSVVDLLAEHGGRASLRRLADAGARYNIGSVHRNFNDPTLALSFLAPSSQARFRFSDAGSEVVEGILVQRVAFDERERPTIIRDERGRRDAPSSGLLFIEPDGSVIRTELRVRTPGNIHSMIRVTFAYEPKLEMMAPRLMEEEYRTTGRYRRELVTGRATYSNYRRFETGGRVLAPAMAPALVPNP